MKCIACNGSGRYDSDDSPPCGGCDGTGEEPDACTYCGKDAKSTSVDGILLCNDVRCRNAYRENRRTIDKNILSKDPKNRMMDLLAGWANFISAEEERKESFVEREINQKVYDLYQEVGQVKVMTDEKMVEFWDKIMNLVEGIK